VTPPRPPPPPPLFCWCWCWRWVGLLLPLSSSPADGRLLPGQPSAHAAAAPCGGTGRRRTTPLRLLRTLPSSSVGPCRALLLCHRVIGMKKRKEKSCFLRLRNRVIKISPKMRRGKNDWEESFLPRKAKTLLHSPLLRAAPPRLLSRNATSIARAISRRRGTQRMW
jgi:hypothetical protein